MEKYSLFVFDSEWRRKNIFILCFIGGVKDRKSIFILYLCFWR
jgi:hypothetical protein